LHPKILGIIVVQRAITKSILATEWYIEWSHWGHFIYNWRVLCAKIIEIINNMPPHSTICRIRLLVLNRI
jgi:hypothetical protein